MTTKEKQIEEFKKRFGVKLITGKERFEVDVAYLAADEEKAYRYVETFLTNELSIYSAKVLKSSRLSRIVLCKNLASLGEKKAGLAELHWVGFTWFLGNQILIDVEGTHDAYSRQVIHHELYHAIDSADDFNGLFDNEWKKLNPPSFTYEADLIQGQNQAAVRGGFISTYAMTAVHEDKAEVFSHMIVDYKGFEAAAKKDAILKRKMLRMKVLMKTVCEEFDDNFWKERAKASTKLERY